MKQIRYIMESVGILMLMSFFRLLSLDAASALAGWLAQKIGPMLGAHKTALRNLRRIYPEKTEAEIKTIAMSAWDNLGRVGGELPYINTSIIGERIKIEGVENLREQQKSGKSILFYSAHYGNWELCSRVARDLGLDMALIYRPANNPLADRIMRFYRGGLYKGFYPKGAQGARELIKAIGEGTHIAMLVDQKMNDGIEVPFMGIPAMTAPAIAQFAYKYKLPTIGCRITRTHGANFVATIFPAEPFFEGERHAAIEKTMININNNISDWIYSDPSQWLWMHNRWPK
jgi:KDO2-lipid IV(A) lauroyltransferase